MNNLLFPNINVYRVCTPQVIDVYGSYGDEASGVFQIRSPEDNGILRVIASSGQCWDHISVSRVDRCPTWQEMEFAKRIFFADDEVCMQLHVRPKDHINCHPNCLHIWRPTDQPLPQPPPWMVG